MCDTSNARGRQGEDGRSHFRTEFFITIFLNFYACQILHIVQMELEVR